MRPSPVPADRAWRRLYACTLGYRQPARNEVCMSRRLLLRALPVALALLSALPARAAAPDWAALREVGTVEVVTQDEDGAARETTVWFALLDGSAYIRTGRSSWGDNLERSPELVLRAGEAAYPFRVEFVEDDAERQRITDAFREKYGFTDQMVSWVRGARPRIMRLVPRE
jgi:hypothetical protein